MGCTLVMYGQNRERCQKEGVLLLATLVPTTNLFDKRLLCGNTASNSVLQDKALFTNLDLDEGQMQGHTPQKKN